MKNYKTILAKPSHGSKPWAIWNWNLSLSKEDVDFQLNELIDKGFGGIAIKIGRDMSPAFMSQEFIALFIRALEIAKEKGVFIRFAEDFSFNHSHSFALLAQNNLSFRAQRLVCTTNDIVLNGNTLDITVENADQAKVIAVKYKKDKIDLEQLKPIPVSAAKNQVSFKAAGGDWRLFVFTKEYAKGPCGNFVPNVYNNKVMAAYISSVTEELKGYFNKFIPTVFQGFITEMPSIHPANNSIPWDDDLIFKYRTKYKKELWDTIPALFGEIEAKDARLRPHVYNFMLQNMFDQFAGPLDEWCKKNRLNNWVIGNEKPAIPQPNSLGELFSISEGKFATTSIGNHEGVEEGYPFIKAVADASVAAGRKNCTILGRNGQYASTSLQMLKNEFDRQVTVAASDILIDGFFANIDHQSTVRSSFTSFWYSREWEAMDQLTNYGARLRELTETGRTSRDIAVLLPTSSLLADYTPNSDTMVKKGLEQLKSVTNELDKLHLEYDILAEDALCGCTIRQNGEFGAAGGTRKGNFRALIVPYSRLISRTVFVFIEKIAVKGGLIIFVENAPQGSVDDGISPSFTQRVDKLLNAKVPAVHALPVASIAHLLEKLEPVVSITVAGKRCSDISCHMLSDADGVTYAIRNNSEIHDYVTVFGVPAGKAFYLVDCHEGSIHEISDVITEKGVSFFSLTLQPRQSILVVGTAAKIAGINPVKDPTATSMLFIGKKDYRLVLRNQWKFLPESLNVLPLSGWSTRIGLSRESGGFSHYYEAYFDVKDIPNTALFIMSNAMLSKGCASESIEILVNGNKLKRIDPAMPAGPALVADGAPVVHTEGKSLITLTPWLRNMLCYNLKAALTKGVNRVAIRTSGLFAHPPVVAYPPLVVGDFIVEKGAKGWIINNSVPTVGIDSWGEYGFSYLSGCGVYSQIFEIPSDYSKLILKFTDVSGPIEIFINGIRQSALTMQPMQLDITAGCTQKRNDLTIRVYNTIDNLLRMNRRPSGILGEVFVDVY